MDFGNTYFQRINRCLGWGEPEAGLWLIGIEERAAYTSLDDIDRAIPDDMEFLEIKAGATSSDRKRYNASPVISYTSKIASQLSKSAYRNSWEVYRDNVLWQKGSKICQANLYPLGKQQQAQWPPNNLHLFGLEHVSRNEYLNYIHETRFKYLRQSWEKNRATATICFGKSVWNDFRSIFSLESSNKEHICGGQIELFPAQKIMLIPHFSSRLMSDRFAYEIANEITNRWNISLP